MSAGGSLQDVVCDEVVLRLGHDIVSVGHDDDHIQARDHHDCLAGLPPDARVSFNGSLRDECLHVH